MNMPVDASSATNRYVAEHTLKQMESPDEAQQERPQQRNTHNRSSIEQWQRSNFKNSATQGNTEEHR